MPIRTVADVKQAILQKSDKYSAEFESFIDNELEQWIWQLSDVFPFWFLTISPGTALQEAEAFPIADLSATSGVYPGVLPSGERPWVDIGWLRTNPGQAVYDLAAPEEDSQAANGSWWRPRMAKQIDYIFEFSQKGNPCRDIPIPDYDGGMLRVSLSKRGTPIQAMWRNLESHSQVIFSPTPDKQRLYAIQYIIKNPESYVDPDSGQTRNRFLTYAPEAVVAKGLYEAAKHFGETEMIAFYSRELYGASPEDHAASSKLTGGILGRLKRDTTARARSLRDQIEYWKTTDMFRRGGVYSPSGNRQMWNNPYSRRWWR